MKITDQSVTLIDHMGSDLSVVNAARVSFHKESDWEMDGGWIVQDDKAVPLKPVLSEKDQKLIAYLAKHNHWTPFAHAFLSFRIKAPIFVARQLVKHQVGLAWNEVSRRYVDDEPEFWFPKTLRLKADNKKQGSSDEVHGGSEDLIDDLKVNLAQNALYLYKVMLEENVAPEQARMILPQNMMTEWIWSGSLAAFARVCRLRLDPHAQAETQEIAKMINAQVPEGFKYSWQALLA